MYRSARNRNEIEPATGIVKFIASLSSGPEVAAVTVGEDYDSYKPSRRKSRWTDRLPQVVGLDIDPDSLSGALALKAEDGIAPELIEELKADSDRVVVLGSEVSNALGHLRAFLTVLKSEGVENPVIVCRDYTGLSEQERTIAASVEFGSLPPRFCRRSLDQSLRRKPRAADSSALNILQATRLRISKTEFISYPGCGRTLYDLQSTLREIKAATSHLKD